MAGPGRDAHTVFAADTLATRGELRAQAAQTCGVLEDPALGHRLERYEESLRMLQRERPLSSSSTIELWP